MYVTDHLIKCESCGSVLAALSLSMATSRMVNMVSMCMECLDKTDLDNQGLTEEQINTTEEFLETWRVSKWE